MNTTRNRAASRRGSALLIVLGMLAFMIISAVAFSAYMRFSRMPSSFLRRTSASRLLVKAALARAIDEIDASIGNNPHPGVGTVKTRYPRNMESSEGAVGELQERNIWLHRVFFGSICDDDGSVRSDIIDAPDGIKDSTVSPLSLEALAYIPPPLVNEARYFSRRSPAAVWKSLGFDAGRYAFCALDVSDYFDINRMTAAAPRSSAGNRRVSLGYIFENDAHTSAGADAASWDSWMEKFRTINDDSVFEWSGSVAPFVSVADFNLAFGHNGGVGRMISPFYKFIQDGSRNTFYAASGDADYDRLNRMTFVTDGLFPSEDESKITSNDDKPFDLSDKKYQPFNINPSGSGKPSTTDLLMGGAHQNEAEMGWHKRLGGVGLAALYDYLDPDHVPISLALPTTERVPMICGIQPMMNGATLKVNKQIDPAYDKDHGDQPAAAEGALGSTRQCKIVVNYHIDPNSLNPMGGAINAIFVYPFSKNTEYSDKFKVDGRFSYFFSTEQMSLRTGNNNPNNEILHIKDRRDFNPGSDAGVDDATGLMNIAFMPTDLSFDTKNAPESEEKAVKDVTLPFAQGGAASLGLRLQNERKLLSVTYKWTQRFTTEWGATLGGVRAPSWGPVFSAAKDDGGANLTVDACTTDLCIVNAKGIRDTNVKKLMDDGKPIYLNVAVWLRIKNKDGNVVDMVPACLGDDTIQNPSGGGPNGFDMLNGGEFGQYFPLMRFDTAGQGSCASITLSVDELDKLADGTTQPSQISLWPQSAIVADPRFNHAPENWFSAGGTLNPNAWLDNNHSSDNGCDGDIFMEVSDNGYLQSKYELAMLPACATLRNTGNAQGQGRMKLFTTYNGNSIPSDFGTTVQGSFMWRTYDPLGDHADEFYDIKWVSDKKGYRVCPYSDSTNVIMAAFANTPLNWACAGTNDVDDAVNFNYSDPKSPDGAGFNKKFAWNEYSTGGKFAWEDLTAIAGNFIDKVREKGADWEEAWDELGWYDNTGDKFCGVSLSGNTDDLWNVDRKFLYGFWKDCFAAKQQLFLVFVRAEPAMMGSGNSGQTPPQLGARAVALVWRNPATPSAASGSSAASSNTTPPHQTRVLFYRQLD